MLIERSSGLFPCLSDEVEVENGALAWCLEVEGVGEGGFVELFLGLTEEGDAVLAWCLEVEGVGGGGFV